MCAFIALVHATAAPSGSHSAKSSHDAPRAGLGVPWFSTLSLRNRAGQSVMGQGGKTCDVLVGFDNGETATIALVHVSCNEGSNSYIVFPLQCLMSVSYIMCMHAATWLKQLHGHTRIIALVVFVIRGNSDIVIS